jgi:hypothetical protein
LIKLQRAFEKCIEEMEDDVDPALTAVAHNTPFKLIIHAFQENPYVKKVAAKFFRDINKFNESEQAKKHKDFESNTNSTDVRQFEFLTYCCYLCSEIYTSEDIPVYLIFLLFI